MNLEKQLASLDLRKSALDREQLFFQLGKSQASRLPQARAFLAGAFIACLPWIMMISASKNLPISNSFSEQIPNPVEKKTSVFLLWEEYSLKPGNYPKARSWIPNRLSKVPNPGKTDYSCSNLTNFWSNHENFS